MIEVWIIISYDCHEFSGVDVFATEDGAVKQLKEWGCELIDAAAGKWKHPAGGNGDGSQLEKKLLNA